MAIVLSFALQTQTDAILGWVDKSNGRAFLMDTWINGYNPPVLDSSQDIFNSQGRIENGETTLTFSRKRATKDPRDLSFSDDQCLYLMFPVKGGTFNPVNKKIRKHDLVPIVSAQKLCIKSCGNEGTCQIDVILKSIVCILCLYVAVKNLQTMTRMQRSQRLLD